MVHGSQKHLYPTEDRVIVTEQQSTCMSHKTVPKPTLTNVTNPACDLKTRLWIFLLPLLFHRTETNTENKKKITNTLLERCQEVYDHLVAM